MDEKIYISHDLYYLKNKLYFSDSTKDILVNDKNWHIYLNDYGWEKLPYGWKIRLKEKGNFKFGLLDCGSQGDCLFHCISEALNSNNLENNSYDVSKLRKITSESINEDNFEIILLNYKCEVESNTFNGLWEPMNIQNIKQLQDEINKEGDSFWGDHILLQLLLEKLELNVIILNDKIDNNEYTIRPLACDINKYSKTIILYYHDECHFQLVGYFNNNKMNTLFEKDVLPKVLLDVYYQDCNLNYKIN